MEKYLKTVNDYVEEAMSSRRMGIEPSLLSHLGWTSRITSRFLSDMDYERQVEAYKSRISNKYSVLPSLPIIRTAGMMPPVSRPLPKRLQKRLVWNLPMLKSVIAKPAE
ncbi:MAG: hypothetical protein ACLU99_04965 [Alphaproteobacteria bacterium]